MKTECSTCKGRGRVEAPPHRCNEPVCLCEVECPHCKGEGVIADVPADRMHHPAGCPDADWCRGNRVCYWQCNVGDSP